MTGQAAWYDLRVRIEKAAGQEPESAPQFATLKKLREGEMTSLPPPAAKKLGLVIDLDTCVGCQACVTSCKEWNTQGYSAPLSDDDPYGSDPDGVWLNRVHGYEVKEQGQDQTRIVHFPRSCLHCEDAGLRHRLPHRRLLQARGRRHRAGQPGHLHRLQALFLGLSLWRARI